MNQYEQAARREWAQYMPERMEALVEAGTADEFFHDLGVQCETQIASMRDQMWAGLPKDLDDQERAGQMRMIVKQAEERVLYDLVYAPVGEYLGDPGNLDLEELIGELPGADSLRETKERFLDRRQEEAEEEGSEPGFLEQELEEMAIWDRLIEIDETWEKTGTVTPEMEAFARNWVRLRDQDAL